MGRARARTGGRTVVHRVARNRTPPPRSLGPHVARLYPRGTPHTRSPLAGHRWGIREPRASAGALTMHGGRRRTRSGMTLLEVMVALIVLTLVGAGYFELVAQSHRLSGSTVAWSSSVLDAQDALESAKLGAPDPAQGAPVRLPDGSLRRVLRRPWAPGFTRVTVEITSPEGQRIEVDRLVRPVRSRDGRETEQW